LLYSAQIQQHHRTAPVLTARHRTSEQRELEMTVVPVVREEVGIPLAIAELDCLFIQRRYGFAVDIAGARRLSQPKPVPALDDFTG
jgi:hypothetical protein